MTRPGPEARLAELGITLPQPAAPAANYVPARRSGSFVYIAGQVPTAEGKDRFVGKVGRDLTIEEAQQAARLCAVNVLAQLKSALGGSLDGVVGCVRLGGFVNAVPEFDDCLRIADATGTPVKTIQAEATRAWLERR